MIKKILEILWVACYGYLLILLYENQQILSADEAELDIDKLAWNNMLAFNGIIVVFAYLIVLSRFNAKGDD